MNVRETIESKWALEAVRDEVADVGEGFGLLMSWFYQRQIDRLIRRLAPARMRAVDRITNDVNVS